MTREHGIVEPSWFVNQGISFCRISQLWDRLSLGEVAQDFMEHSWDTTIAQKYKARPFQG